MISGTEDLLSLLQPIHEQKKISESNKVTVSMVYQRRLDVFKYLHSHIRVNRFGKDLAEYLHQGYVMWMRKQVIEIHKVAWFLHPRNRCERLTPMD